MRTAMRPSEIIELLSRNITKSLPTILWGGPGIGKTAVGHELARVLGFRLIDWYAPIYQPVDLTGGMVVTDGYTTFAPPRYLLEINEPTLFLLDDIGFADERMQQALLKLIHERKVGHHTVPDHVYFLATSNRLGDRASVRRLISPMTSRFHHIDFEVNADDWLAWAGRNGIISEIRSFIAFKRSALYTFSADKDQRSFACPRTWAALSAVYHSTPEEQKLKYFSGLIDEGTTIEFLAHTELYHRLPPAREIAEMGDRYQLPDNPAERYVIVTSLGDYAKTAAKEKNMQHLENILKLADVLPADFSLLLVRDTLRASHDVQRFTIFGQLLAKHGTVLNAY